MLNAKCKICRRVGVKLFLKGEKCLSPKCIVVKRPYPPGVVGKKRRRKPLSEFGKEVREKQKLKSFYNLKEHQFRNYVREILKKKRKLEDPSTLLIRKLENRFDNIIFRLGFASSHAQARQFVNHGHFLLNNRRVTIPSHQLKKGDKVSIYPVSQKMKMFENLNVALKKHQLASWLKLDTEKLEGEVLGFPTLEESALPGEISAIFEYYSR